MATAHIERSPCTDDGERFSTRLGIPSAFERLIYAASPACSGGKKPAAWNNARRDTVAFQFNAVSETAQAPEGAGTDRRIRGIPAGRRPLRRLPPKAGWRAAAVRYRAKFAQPCRPAGLCTGQRRLRGLRANTHYIENRMKSRRTRRR
jgi:hypothetical protein